MKPVETEPALPLQVYRGSLEMISFTGDAAERLASVGPVSGPPARRDDCPVETTSADSRWELSGVNYFCR